MKKNNDESNERIRGVVLANRQRRRAKAATKLTTAIRLIYKGVVWK